MILTTKVRLEQIVELTWKHDVQELSAIRELVLRVLADEEEVDRVVRPLFQYFVGEPEYWH